jgi:RimJ/RimL family protein N-acetyltransferase
VRIAEICNQPRLYRRLFEKRLSGLPYTPEMARGFTQWAERGWFERTHFVFWVQTLDGMVVSACDIKSNNLHSSEIGYWSSAEHPGVMTPAVSCLCALAKQAGFLSLFAKVEITNIPSQRVLERNEFHKRDSEKEGIIEFHKTL